MSDATIVDLRLLPPYPGPEIDGSWLTLCCDPVTGACYAITFDEMSALLDLTSKAVPNDGSRHHEQYVAAVNDALDILERYINVPRACWNQVLGLIDGRRR